MVDCIDMQHWVMLTNLTELATFQFCFHYCFNLFVFNNIDNSEIVLKYFQPCKKLFSC